jgi:hypothetical protein
MSPAQSRAINQMTINPSLVLIGTAAAIGAITADVGQGLGSAAPTAVTLTADLTLANPMPPGFPTEPSQTGVAVAGFYAPGSVIPSGTKLSVFPAVATALVNAGAATAP